MKHLEILKTVYFARKPKWGGAQQYTAENLREDLGIKDASDATFLSDAVISSVINGKGKENDIENFSRQLEVQDTRYKIERSLGLDDIFECKSYSSVIEKIQSVDQNLPEDDRTRISIESGRPENVFGFEKSEFEARDTLSGMLLENNRPFIHISVAFNIGTSAIARNLWERVAEDEKIKSIVFLRPSSFDDPFGNEFVKLGSYLASIGKPVSSIPQLIETLIEERILVVLFSLETLDTAQDNNSAIRLIKELEARKVDWKGSSILLAIGESKKITEATNDEGHHPTHQFSKKLGVRDEKRYGVFLSQCERFSIARNSKIPDETSAKVRRAAEYYNIINKKSVWPISVKLRALFVTNSNYAYFDPTQGFTKLAGLDYERFGDIKNYHLDAQDYFKYQEYLNKINNTKHKQRTYLLHYISTAKHWLTDETLSILIQKISRRRKNSKQLETEKKRILNLNPIVTKITKSKENKYVASLALKAIIQENWKTIDPYSRSVAHFRIAECLKENANNNDFLKLEFPYEPHWGGSHIFILAETIRHLVRSCETAIFAGEPNRDNKTSPTFEISYPTEDREGACPEQTINYCYSNIFQKELNKNSSGVIGRAMAREYGAYQLSAELLELMSDNQVIGVPHPHLNEKKRFEFIRDCGFSLLDIGELENAKICFYRAISELEGEAVSFKKLDAMMDVALVESVMGHTDKVNTLLQQVEVWLQELVVAEHSKEQFRQLRKLYRRYLGRKAHLCFLEQNYDEAYDLIDKIRNESRWSQFKKDEGYERGTLVPIFIKKLEVEQSHILIAILRIKADRDEIGTKSDFFCDALNHCLDSLLVAQTDRRHHDAMGFRIILARLFRKMERYRTAETILNAVQSDISRFGCSERTYLAFLNEYARTLFKRGQPIRTYATFVRPCLIRAIEGGFEREAIQAKISATTVLTDIKARYKRHEKDPDRWQNKLDLALERHQEYLTRFEVSSSEGIEGKDTLYAFAVANIKGIIDSFKSSEGINNEIKLVDETMEKKINDPKSLAPI